MDKSYVCFLEDRLNNGTISKKVCVLDGIVCGDLDERSGGRVELETSRGVYRSREEFTLEQYNDLIAIVSGCIREGRMIELDHPFYKYHRADGYHERIEEDKKVLGID